MALDSLTERDHRVRLLERYGPLLSDLQREVLDLHLLQDWSLAEVAEVRGTSRAAVHDIVRRATLQLEAFEAQLGLCRDDAEREVAAVAVERRLAELKRLVAELDAAIAALRR